MRVVFVCVGVALGVGVVGVCCFLVGVVVVYVDVPVGCGLMVVCCCLLVVECVARSGWHALGETWPCSSSDQTW